MLHVVALRFLASLFTYAALIFIEKQYGSEYLGMYTTLLSLASYALLFIPLQINSYLLHLLAVDNKSHSVSTHILFALLSFGINCFIALPVILFFASRTPLPGYFGQVSVLMLLITFSANNYLEGIWIALRRPRLSSLLYFFRSSWILILLPFAYINTLRLVPPVLIQIIFEAVAFIFSTRSLLGSLKFGPSLSNIFQQLRYYPHWYKQAFQHGIVQTLSGFLFVGSITIQKFFMINYSEAKALGSIVLLYSMVVFLPNLYEASYAARQLPSLISLYKPMNALSPKELYLHLRSSAPKLLIVNLVSSLIILIFLQILPRFLSQSIPFQVYLNVVLFTLFSVIYSFSRLIAYYIYASGFFISLLICSLVAFCVAIFSFSLLNSFFGSFSYALSLVFSIASFMLACIISVFLRGNMRATSVA